MNAIACLCRPMLLPGEPFLTSRSSKLKDSTNDHSDERPFQPPRGGGEAVARQKADGHIHSSKSMVCMLVSSYAAARRAFSHFTKLQAEGFYK